MASFGPGKSLIMLKKSLLKIQSERIFPEELNASIAAYKLEHSFIGILGKSIEPAIAPLGFDWKIGIA